MNYLQLFTQKLSFIQELNNDEVLGLVVEKELSGNYSISFSLPFGASGYEEIVNGKYIKANGQYFTINNVNIDRLADNTMFMHIDCVHIFFEIDHMLFAEDEEKRLTLYEHLSFIFRNTSFVPIVIGHLPSYMISRHIEYKKGASRLEGLQSILNVYGGNFILDGFNFKLYSEYSELPPSNTTFTYAINNQRIRKTTDSTNVVTKLYATGGILYLDPVTGEEILKEDDDGNTLELPSLELALNAPPNIINSYRIVREQAISFGDIKLPNNLQIVADRYLSNHQEPRMSYNLSIAELRHIDEAKSMFNMLFEFDIGQMVRVRDLELGILIDKPVQNYIYRPLEPDYVAAIVVGDKIHDLFLKEESKDDGMQEWRYDEKIGEWVPVTPIKEDDKYGDVYQLHIAKTGDYGNLRLRYKPSVDRYEKSTLSINNIATNGGNVLITLSGNSYSIAVNAGDSRNRVADKIAAVVYPGWDVEQKPHTVEFIATDYGSKEHSLEYSPQETGAEGSARTTKGTIADQFTHWFIEEYPFNNMFGGNDIVEIIPQDGYDDNELLGEFIEWLGDGSGSPTRTFTMDKHKDALAIYTTNEATKGQGYNLHIISSGTTGELKYRFKSGVSRKEVSTLTIDNVATESGNIQISLSGVTKTIAIQEGDSRNTTAEKIAAEDYTGWNVERDRWIITFTAQVAENKPTNAVIYAGNTGVVNLGDEGMATSFKTVKGCEVDVFTRWITTSYPLSENFGIVDEITTDIVEVMPIGDHFIRWVGDGSGSSTRTFIISRDQDAEAVYEDIDDSKQGSDYSLYINAVKAGSGHLLYRFKTNEDVKEVVKVMVNAGSTHLDTITLSLNGMLYAFSIPFGMGRVGIAEKLSLYSYDEWDVEYDGGWTLTFTAKEFGRKLYAPTYDAGITGSAISFSVTKGSIENEVSDWIIGEFPFNEKFNVGDQVWVVPNTESVRDNFVMWTGEGEGEVTRYFLVENDLDATAHFEFGGSHGIVVELVGATPVEDPYGDSFTLEGLLVELQKYDNAQCGFFWMVNDSEEIEDPTLQIVDLSGATGGYYQLNAITFAYNAGAAAISIALNDFYNDVSEESFDLHVSKDGDKIYITCSLWILGSDLTTNFSLLEGAGTPRLIGYKVIRSGNFEEGDIFSSNLNRTESHGTEYVVRAFATHYDKEHELHMYDISSPMVIMFPHEDWSLTFKSAVRGANGLQPTKSVNPVFKLDGAVAGSGIRYFPDNVDVDLEVNVGHNLPYTFAGWAINTPPLSVVNTYKLYVGNPSGGHFYVGNKSNMVRIAYNGNSNSIKEALDIVYAEWDDDGNKLPNVVTEVIGSAEPNIDFVITFTYGKGNDMIADFFYLDGAVSPEIGAIDTLNTSPAITLTMDENKDVYAVIDYHPPQITVNKGSGAGMVRVQSKTFELPCNITELIQKGELDGTGNFTLYAVPEDGYHFIKGTYLYTENSLQAKNAVEVEFKGTLTVNINYAQKIALYFDKDGAMALNPHRLALRLYEYARSRTGTYRELPPNIAGSFGEAMMFIQKIAYDLATQKKRSAEEAAEIDAAEKAMQDQLKWAEEGLAWEEEIGWDGSSYYQNLKSNTLKSLEDLSSQSKGFYWKLPDKVMIKHTIVIKEPCFRFMIDGIPTNIDPTKLKNTSLRIAALRYTGEIINPAKSWVNAVARNINFAKANAVYRTANGHVTQGWSGNPWDWRWVEKTGTIVKTTNYDPKRIVDNMNLNEIEAEIALLFVTWLNDKIGIPEDAYMEIGASTLAQCCSKLYGALQSSVGTLTQVRTERKEKAYIDIGVSSGGEINIEEYDAEFGDRLTTVGLMDLEPFTYEETGEPDDDIGREDDIWLQYEGEE